jgi:23S rRNA (cytidine1920-2'-O)/16S rRNA (cytidine1409-2'-O)-methyltransferase
MAAQSTRIRLDELLVRRGLAPSRQQARALVLAGRVAVPGVGHVKPGLAVAESTPIEVAAAPTFVSRGGLKLAHALDRFTVGVEGRVCADIGASTGGFTDCLLQRGAAKVFAIDVGYGQLDWRLRTDPRVVVMERTNARYLERLAEPVDLVVIDASFISLRMLLPTAERIAAPAADVIALVKPQFEAGKERVGKGGVVRDPTVHRDVLRSLADWTRERGLALVGMTASPIRGPAGNVEFLAHLVLDASGAANIEELVTEALRESGVEPGHG